MNLVKVNNITIGGNKQLVLIAGPCVVENEYITLSTAEKVKSICEKHGVDYIFKASYKKANRTSVESFTGLDRDDALKILRKIKEELNLPVLTDIHTEPEAAEAATVADVLQIPAFLCRQTDLLVAAGNTGKVVNIKKGQFLAPQSMSNAVGKVESTGNKNIMLTERGTTFGYNNLVVDMRSFLIMKETGYPVVMDATHSVQMPGTGNVTGGNPEYIAPLARAAAAVGIDALFIETHPDPENAKSDAASQLPLDKLEETLLPILAIDKTVKGL
ncbi:MAG: 2-dehydro-3-deoxyphosphooctonate aldolase [Melioribacteraceae bacterium]|nr:MAG: 2-dehydro-3-deoxyphosphooctonate aldolase [Melioribacteraceae bacterium]